MQMKNLLTVLILLTSFYGCVPEQEAIDFGVTITPMSGEDKEMITKEDEPLLVTYEIPVAEDAENVEVKIVEQPKHGSLDKCEYLNPTKIQCIYNPSRDYFGKDTIGFKGKDGDFFAQEMSVLDLTITPVPDAPVSAKNQNKRGPENSLIKFKVSAGSDVDSTDLRYEIVNDVTQGSLSDCLESNKDLDCVYEPTANFIGDVTFSYKVIDDGDLSSENISRVTIKVLDTPEVGADQEISVDQYSVVKFQVNPATDNDSNSAELTYLVSEKPNNGTLENCFLAKGNLSCSYKPNYGYLGVDSFKYKVMDETNLKSVDEATVSFVINKVNLPPVASAPQTIDVLQNGSKTFTINMAKDEDSESTKLNYVVVTSPTKGALTNCLVGVGVTNCTYTPNQNVNGIDSMTYKVVDDTGVSSKIVGTIKFNIIKVYQKPVVGMNQKVGLPQGTKKEFNVSAGKDVDTDSSQLKYTIVKTPAKGALENCFLGKGKLNCTYAPRAKESGSDFMTYKIVDDKGLSSNIATVEFNILPKNYPKVGELTSISLNQFDKKKFVVNKGSDADTNEFSLLYKISSNPKNGKLSECFIQVGDLNCVYTPNTNFYGVDSFQYFIEDDYGLKSGIGNVEIVINARAKPVPYPLNKFKTTENTKVEFSVTQAIDLDSSATVLKYKLVELPKSGLLKNCFVSTGHYGCEYMPNNNFYGVDQFKYSVTDEKGLKSDTLGVVQIEVTKKLPPVIGSNNTFTTKQNVMVKTTATLASDDDTPVSELEYKIVTQPLYGALSTCFLLKGGRDCNYTPKMNFYGTDSFTYKVIDKNGLESVANGKVTITVEKVAVKPKVGADQFFKLSKNEVKTFEVNLAIDPDSDLASMGYILVAGPTNGVLSNCFSGEGKRTCTYTPTVGYYGSDKITYKVKDDGGLTSDKIATVFLEVVDVTAKPIVGANQSFDILQGNNLTFTVPKGFDKDSADNLLNYFVVANPKEGSLLACFLIAGNKQCTYTPSKLFYGKDTFQYKIKDETGYISSLPATVTFNVIQRKAPVAQAQTISVKQYSKNNAFSVTPAVDPDSSAINLTYLVTTQPKNGTLSDCFITKGYTGCKYTPNDKFYGVDVVKYKVTDEYNISSVSDGVLSIVVGKVNLKPSVGANQSVTLDMNTSKVVIVNKGKDPDSALGDLKYKVVQQPKNGTLSSCFLDSTNLECTYTPTQYFYGSDSITYKVVDETNLESTSVATISFVINKVNIAPVAGKDQTFAMITNKVKTITVSSGSDLDGQAINLQYSISAAPKNGVLSACFKGEGVRTCTYTPNPGFYGSDSFTHNVKDLTGLVSGNVSKVTFLVEKPKIRPIVGADITINAEAGKATTFSVPLASDGDSVAGDLVYRLRGYDSGASAVSSCISVYNGATNPGVRTCTVTPLAAFNGSFDITYDVMDESGLISTTQGKVRVNVGGATYQGADTFTQGSSEKMKGVDFIWVIDNSGSMGNEQSTLSNSFESFVGNLLINGVARYPFDMFVTTTDSRHQTQYFGKLNSIKAESAFATFKSDFKTAVKVGTRGSGSEKAYQSASNFYGTHSSSLGGNDRLAVYITVSDEREQSTNKNIQQWANHFQATKDNAAKVRFYNIVESDSGNRYKNMAAYTGGTNYSIRNNFDGILSSISSTITTLLDSYLLTGGRTVDAGSIVVKVDGVQIPDTDWVYGLNSIKFLKVPVPGAKIEINYNYTIPYIGN
jgi:hypothetical protein